MELALPEGLSLIRERIFNIWSLVKALSKELEPLEVDTFLGASALPLKLLPGTDCLVRFGFFLKPGDNQQFQNIYQQYDQVIHNEYKED